MSVIYVARSKTLSDWGASVGISKSLFKVGVADGTGKSAVAELNNNECAGLNDWRLVGSEDVDDFDEDAALDRLAITDTLVEPNYYPRIPEYFASNPKRSRTACWSRKRCPARRVLTSR